MSGLCCVATTKEGGVEVVHPMAECVRALMRGGAISVALQWRDGMRTWLAREFDVPVANLDRWDLDGVPLEIAMSWEAHKLIASKGWRTDLAHDHRVVLAWLWVRSLAFGGLTERAAIELIFMIGLSNFARDAQIMDAADIPTDRSNRDRWRRGHNSGLIVTGDI
jgi:hypothetical protein